MTEMLHGLPYWELRFDAHGDPDGDQRDALLSELPAAGVTDLFVFSHGWNNSPDTARRFYDRFFGLLAEDAAARGDRSARIGLAGVIWPSMRWADESIPDFPQVAAAGLDDGPAREAGIFAELRECFATPGEQDALDRMEVLLRDKPDDDHRLAEFQELMAKLGAETLDEQISDEDSGEQSLVQETPQRAFGKFLPAGQGLSASTDEGGAAGGFLDQPDATPGDEQGAAGFGDLTKRLWGGAKEALRQFTYFQMKKRAGTVGRKGLGPMIGAIRDAQPSIRVHLIGHSFGARLVSFALAGLPDVTPSPVKSVVLLQGAFSHFAFAPKLPHRDGTGVLAGQMARVDGPLVAAHSVHDSAVGTLYRVASMGSGEDAAGLSDRTYRWGAIGGGGAQAVDAAEVTLGARGQAYALAHGAFTNVDAGDVVRRGGPPSGAHSDIFHPELSWLTLSAAGLART